MQDIAFIDGIGQVPLVDLTIDRGVELRPDQLETAERTGLWPAKKPYFEISPANISYLEMLNLRDGERYSISVTTDQHGPRYTFRGENMVLRKIQGDYSVGAGAARMRYRFEGERFGDIRCVA